jgi:hypothetical protein
MASISMGSFSAAEFTLTLSAPASKTCSASEQLTRRSAHRIQQRGAALVGRGNVEQHNLVGAFAGMTRGLRGRIAGVDDVHKLHALDDTTIAHVKTGNDALGNHSVPFPFQERKLLRIFSPVAPDFSG